MLGNPQYNVGLDRRKKNLEKMKNTSIIRELVGNLYKETNNLENFGQIFYDAQNNIQFFQELSRKYTIKIQDIEIQNMIKLTVYW